MWIRGGTWRAQLPVFDSNVHLWNSVAFGRTVRCMKRLFLPLVFVTFLLGPLPLQSAKKTPTFDVHGPTILAFFPPVTEAELLKDPDANTALDDFQFYARKVRQPLEKKGIEFREVYAHRFSIRRGTTVLTFAPKKTQVGYYFVAPGKKPHIEYGVMTDADLLQAADEYFRAAQR